MEAFFLFEFSIIMRLYALSISRESILNISMLWLFLAAAVRALRLPLDAGGPSFGLAAAILYGEARGPCCFSSLPFMFPEGDALLPLSI